MVYNTIIRNNHFKCIQPWYSAVILVKNYMHIYVYTQTLPHTHIYIHTYVYIHNNTMSHHVLNHSYYILCNII